MTSEIDFFSMVLHIGKSWIIVKVNLERVLKRLDVSADFQRDSEFEYIAKKAGTHCEYKLDDKIHRYRGHLNFFEFGYHILERALWLKLPEGGIRIVQKPWREYQIITR